jgi:hypothetical protein
VFSHKLSERAELRLLEERHAEELSELTNRNRDHLRAWLPWIDHSRTVEDRRKFIIRSLKQFAENTGFQAGFGTTGVWQEWWDTTHRLAEPWYHVGLLARKGVPGQGTNDRSVSGVSG